MLLGKVLKWLSRTLLETIPTYLHTMLEGYIGKDGVSRNSHLTFHQMLAGERKVYDLVNCGPMNRFMVGPSRPMIAHNCQYGAGVNKIMQTLEQDDVFLSYEEVELIHKSYWNTFAGVQDFSKALYYEWKRNGGWILNGVGRPMCIPEHMTKDILNRFVQSTGHDILVKYICILTKRLDEDLPNQWKPLIIDLHDATTVEVPEEHADLVCRIMSESVDELNRQLNGTIKLRGVPEAGFNLADVKSPEE